jgi:hypothetical protein
MVDELMTLHDHREAKLRQTRAQSEWLLAGAVRHIMNGGHSGSQPDHEGSPLLGNDGR